MKFASNRLARARPLLGTFVEIVTAGTAAPQMEAAIEAAFAAVERVHHLMSFHDPASDVSRFNRKAFGRAIAIDAWTYMVLEIALDLHRRSNGVFDIAVAPILQRLGLLPAFEEGGGSSSKTFGSAAAVELLPGNRVRMREDGSKIDLGGIAKGFAVDRAVDVLREHAIPSGLVNAGGDLAAFGPDDHTVDVRNPRHPGQLLCRVAVRNAALASSGLIFDPVQPHGSLHSAIIDPESSQPVTAICGATVRAPCCLVADALTKVVMIAGSASSETLDHYGASALFVTASGEVRVTADWLDALRSAA